MKDKILVIVIFSLLFLMMILDNIFEFPTVFKAVFYGGSLLIGGLIYFFSVYKGENNSEN